MKSIAKRWWAGSCSGYGNTHFRTISCQYCSALIILHNHWPKRPQRHHSALPDSQNCDFTISDVFCTICHTALSRLGHIVTRTVTHLPYKGSQSSSDSNSIRSDLPNASVPFPVLPVSTANYRNCALHFLGVGAQWTWSLLVVHTYYSTIPLIPHF